MPMIQVSDTVRVETSPRRKRAVATKELLDDAVTAKHYRAPRKATREEIANPNVRTIGDQVVSIDAMGKPIKLGEEMDYIDWKAPADNHTWNVYQEQDVPEKDNAGKNVTVRRYLLHSTHDTQEEAIQAAAKL